MHAFSETVTLLSLNCHSKTSKLNYYKRPNTVSKANIIVEHTDLN